MYQQHYSKFLTSRPERLHFAAHSHHYWLDVTRDAHLQYWDDAAQFADKKWNHIFSTILPKAQEHIAKYIDLTHPEQIAVAPNTHEFILRILSTFESFPIKVLTTDSEFYSFERQLSRFEERNLAIIDRISTAPFESFEERFNDAVLKQKYDLIFFSHVFFNSGYAIRDLNSIVQGVRHPDSLIVVDGYHSFCAIPFSMKSIENRAFYLSGGYKYAQAGEGICFLTVPKYRQFRPLNTGWYAEFGTLTERVSGRVNYSNDGFQFFGSTFDPSGLYRWNSVGDWISNQGLTISKIHDYVSSLQAYFLEHLTHTPLSFLPIQTLIPSQLILSRGHFLTFDIPHADKVEKRIHEKNIVVDRRGSRLRFGFGLYHTNHDIDTLFQRLKSIDQ